jgi:uncharacterized protein
MAQLINQSKKVLISNEVLKATTVWERTKGLLSRSSFEANKTLWIRPCSSIHTYFMQFPIDVAFVDKNLKVTRIEKTVQPWRFVFSTFKSQSVFEFASGVLTPEKIEVGDQLHVDC